MLGNLILFSQIVIENAKIYSAKLGYDEANAKINSAKFTILRLSIAKINSVKIYARENLCP